MPDELDRNPFPDTFDSYWCALASVSYRWFGAVEHSPLPDSNDFPM